MNLRPSIGGLVNFLAVVLIVFGGVSVDCQDCYDIMKQYYECKYLKMIEDQYDMYVPNPKIPNNSLNDSFFYSLNLTNKTFADAIKFVKLIYDTANLKGSRCTQLCNCVGSRLDVSSGFLYPIYFKGIKELNATPRFDRVFLL